MTEKKHHAAKMNPQKVRTARKRWNNGESSKWTIANLARHYGITAQSMGAILHGKTWKHVQ